MGKPTQLNAAPALLKMFSYVTAVKDGRLFPFNQKPLPYSCFTV